MTAARIAVLTALWVLSLATATAQRFSILPPSADTTVWLVNMYPGAEIFQLEGHTALAVQTPTRPVAAYNFGVFDFESPGFVWRFVKGQTDYMAVEWPFDAFVAEYAREGRRVVAHQIDLTSEQKRRLVEALRINVLPQNRTYRYNYVKDNCATRPLAAIESVLPDSICLAPAPYEAQSSRPMTFRNIMRHYHTNYPWYQFGIDLALGSGIDYELSRREAAFAPVELDGMLANATVGGKPLVSRSMVVVDTAPDSAILPPTPWWRTPGAVFTAFFIVTLVVTARDFKRRRTTRWFDSVFFGLVGLTGCLLTFLIFISVHEATSPNFLYVWLNPLALVPAVLVWLKKCKVALFWFQSVNFAVLSLLIVLWPFLPQSANPAFLPIICAEIVRSAAYAIINRP